MSSQSDPQDVASIIEQITTAASALGKQDANARGKLVGLAYRLAASLELPSEALMRMFWAEPSRAALCKIAVDVGLFELLKEKGEAGVNREDAAKATGADVTLINRALKHLAAMNIVQETSIGNYLATPLSNSFTEPGYRDGISYLYDVAGPPFRALPAYLERTKYQNPTELTSGPFQFSHGTKLPFFGWMKENPKQASWFNNYMTGYRGGRPSWYDLGFCPVPERLISTFQGDVSPVLLVDVGGGLGHDLTDLKKKYPNMPGELILQDQESVVASVRDSRGNEMPFKATVHNFFEDQPVLHARAYHLHSVLHDWDDESCIKILRNLTSAMKPGYSSVLIYEMVVPEYGAPWPVTSEDLLMAALGGMHERTMAEWERILSEAGLKATQTWSVEMGSESLIEAELV